MNSGFQYYAIIRYIRKIEKWTIGLHRILKNYIIPSKLQWERKTIYLKRLSSVFKDTTDINDVLTIKYRQGEFEVHFKADKQVDAANMLRINSCLNYNRKFLVGRNYKFSLKQSNKL